MCNIYPKGRGRASLCAAKHKIALTKLQPCVQVDLMRVFKQDGQAFGNQKPKFYTKFEQKRFCFSAECLTNPSNDLINFTNYVIPSSATQFEVTDVDQERVEEMKLEL